MTEVRKLNGEAVTSVTTTEYVGANDSKQFVQVTPAVNEPELWHPAHPSLYKLVSLLYKEMNCLTLKRLYSVFVGLNGQRTEDSFEWRTSFL